MEVECVSVSVSGFVKGILSGLFIGLERGRMGWNRRMDE